MSVDLAAEEIECPLFCLALLENAITESQLLATEELALSDIVC